MGDIWRITSALLVALLLVMSGAGLSAHGRAAPCSSAHCSMAISEPDALDQADQIAVHQGHPAADQNGFLIPQGGCDLSLCHGLMASLPPAVVISQQIEVPVAWRVARDLPLTEPDTPDRPPSS